MRYLRKYGVLPLSILTVGILVSWLYLLLLRVEGDRRLPPVHPSPGLETWQWLERLQFGVKESQPADRGTASATLGGTIPPPPPGVLPLPPPDPRESKEWRLEILTPTPEDSLHSAPGDSPANVEEGETTITPEPPVELSLGRDQEEGMEILGQASGAGKYLGSIRTNVYAFSFERLGLHNIPVARPDRTYWDAQRWDDLEEQLQSAMRYGLTVYPHSPPPGLPGNLVISGHSSPPPDAYGGDFGKVFAVLPETRRGDRVRIAQGGRTFTYEVTDVRVVPATAVDVLLQDGDRKELTLITCYPVGTTRERLIVRATFVEPSVVALTPTPTLPLIGGGMKGGGPRRASP